MPANSVLTMSMDSLLIVSPRKSWKRVVIHCYLKIPMLGPHSATLPMERRLINQEAVPLRNKDELMDSCYHLCAFKQFNWSVGHQFFSSHKRDHNNINFFNL